jgi:cytochrome c peroxidase
MALIAWLLLPTIAVGTDHGSARTAEPITPIPLSVDLPADKVALGELLFNDRDLAGNSGLSCADCHVLADGGDDGRKLADGPGSANMPLNTPTILNIAYNGRIGWFGGHASLAEHANHDLSKRRHDSKPWPALIGYLQANSTYTARFDKLYPDRITRKNILDALTTFERSLITPNAPFDRWLRGDDNALAPQALEGYRRFKQLGCISCHQGINVGGNLFQRIGVFGDFFADKAALTAADQGRYVVTARERDRRVFRVPSLRNVAVTSPYFHDGRTDSLRQAIELVGRFQLNRELSEQDIDQLQAFLESLTGNYQGSPVKDRQTSHE